MNADLEKDDLQIALPIALILYRSGDEDVRKAVRKELLSLMTCHFACLFIEGASNEPGEAGYWLHLYHLLISAADIVLVFDVDNESPSDNINFEQILLTTEKARGQISGQVLELFGIPADQISKCVQPVTAYLHIGYGKPPTRSTSATRLSIPIKTAEGEDPFRYYNEAFTKIVEAWRDMRHEDKFDPETWALRDAYALTLLEHSVIQESTNLEMDGDPVPQNTVDAPAQYLLEQMIEAFINNENVRKEYEAVEGLTQDQIGSDDIVKTIMRITQEELEKALPKVRPNRQNMMIKILDRLQKTGLSDQDKNSS